MKKVSVKEGLGEKGLREERFTCRKVYLKKVYVKDGLHKGRLR